MSINIRPLHDGIVIKRLEETRTSAGGIVIPDTAKEKPSQGKVLAVGPGKVKKDGTRIPPDVAIDDTVLFGKYAGTEVKISGEDLVVMSESDIMAVIEE